MALVERRLEKIDWKERGKSVGGYLRDVLRNKYKDGSIGLVYVVERVDGSVAVFKGTTTLNYQLSPSDRGKFIQVEYVGEDEKSEAGAGMNRAKLFKVSVDKERTLTPNDEGITDADIPF